MKLYHITLLIQLVLAIAAIFTQGETSTILLDGVVGMCIITLFLINRDQQELLRKAAEVLEETGDTIDELKDSKQQLLERLARIEDLCIDSDGPTVNAKEIIDIINESNN